MRRRDIIQGAEQLIAALNRSRIQAAFHLTRRERSDPAGLLAALREFNIHSQNFSVAARKLMVIFDLEGLENPNVWAEALTEQGPMTDATTSIWRGLTFADSFLPKIENLLTEGLPEPIKDSVEGKSDDRSEEVLEFILVDREGSMSRPPRVRDLFEAVEALYHVVATLQGEDSTSLVFASCDSGSEAGFAFLGVPKVVAVVRQMIIDIWDRVVFYRESKVEARSSAIQSTLPVLVEINTREKDGDLEPEQAELLRRAMSDGVTKYLRCGAVTPDLEARAYHNPRQLMAPEVRLLQRPPTVQGEPSSNAGSDQPLSEEERAKLEELLRRANRDK